MTTTNNEIGERVAVIETKIDQMQEKLSKIEELFTTDYAKTKHRIDAMEETIAPFTKLRKRLWQFYITTAISLSVLITIIYENFKEHIK
jgi:DNA-binding protein H-NS